MKRSETMKRSAIYKEVVFIILVCSLLAAKEKKTDKYSATMEANLPGVVGQNLYATGYSHLYAGDTSAKDIKASLVGGEVYFKGYGLIRKQLSPLAVPLLEPLPIIDAEYLPQFRCVLIHLRLPTGEEAVSITTMRMLDVRSADTITNSAEFLPWIAGSLMQQIPTGLTEQEITAIKRRTLFRGMSEGAVGGALGLPDHENTWGDGGKQLVYFDGAMFVYIDSKGKVESWQMLGVK
jgi:hypothetical protein